MKYKNVNKMKIISVVGARPNFMKIAPFIRAIETHNQIDGSRQVEHLLVHTGQHYDDRMSKQFFENLNIPEADINLGVGSGSHAQQVGNTMIEFENVLVNLLFRSIALSQLRLKTRASHPSACAVQKGPH